jgi:hypothetical protein
MGSVIDRSHISRNSYYWKRKQVVCKIKWDLKMNLETGTHHHQKYLQIIPEDIKNHGCWAFPVYPTNRSIQGSPKTPFIWDDRCNAEDAATQIGNVYVLDRSLRKELGKTGRSWAVDEVGFTGEAMGARAINAIDQLFKHVDSARKI